LLELDEDTAPLAGRIGPDDEPGRPFVGYTQLIAAIEVLIAPGKGAPRWP
jgi:hypothetical protein